MLFGVPSTTRQHMSIGMFDTIYLCMYIHKYTTCIDTSLQLDTSKQTLSKYTTPVMGRVVALLANNSSLRVAMSERLFIADKLK